MSREAYTIAGDARLRNLLREKLNDLGLTLGRLEEVCVSRIYRATKSDGTQIFVKWGTVSKSYARDFIAFAEKSSLIPHLIGGSPFILDENPVFCFEWKALHRLRIDQMSDVQFDSFFTAYKNLSYLMQAFGKAAPPNYGEPWLSELHKYVNLHPLSKCILGELATLRSEDCQLPKGASLSITHGDFHSRNFSFTGNELTTFLDFDNFIQGSPVDDLAFAFAECAKRGEMYLPTKCRQLQKRLVAVAQEMHRPLFEWRVAFNLVRLTIAMKTLMRHPSSIRAVFQVALRDRRIQRLYKILNQIA